MGTITLPNFRTTSDITARVRLKDGGLAIDWSGLTGIKAWLYSDDQRAISGRFDVSVDQENPTVLKCDYAATKPQYLGINRIIVQAKYDGRTKTYDQPLCNLVRWTEDQAGEQITLDDPVVDVEIEVTDVDSSILDNAIAAAFDAADRAEAAAAAAEQMVDIHTGPAGKSAYEVAVDEGYTGTEEQWLASLKGETGDTPDISIGTVTTVEPGEPAAASMSGTPEAPVLNLSIPQGLVGATPNFTVGTVTTGEPGTPVVVTITGTPEAPVLNVTIPQGMQGNTGSSVDYPYELVNNLTTNDATKGLSAAQGVVLDGKVSQLEAEVSQFGQEIDEKTVFDISAYHSGSTYATFALAVADIPSDFQKGGIVIKYKDQTTGKYVQYRLLATSFSDVQSDWALDSEAIIEDNPEFVEVHVDAEDRVLYGVQQDGNFLFGAGVPSQIQQELDTKVGVEEGKGLSANDYTDEEKAVVNTTELKDSPEYIQITTDSDDKILEGLKRDGTKVIGGDATILGKVNIQGVIYTLMQSPEWLRVIVDAQQYILCGIKADGSIYLNSLTEIPTVIQNAINAVSADTASLEERITAIESIFSIVDNPEFIQVTTDSEGKTLQSRNLKGVNKEYVGIETPELNIDDNIIENIQDPEGRTEIKTDSEGKVLSYRDSEGVMHEEAGIKSVKVSTNSLNLTADGMTEFQQALKDAGFNPGGKGDWSNYITKKGKNPLHLNEPNLAIINFTNENNDLIWPSSKKGLPDYQKGVNADFEAIIEFYDLQGNYFRKNITFTGQGTSSMAFEKKNVAIKIFDDSIYNSGGKFGKGDGFGTKFGNWVMQTGYHLKAYYTDYLRGSGVIAYKISDEVYKTRGIFEDRPWKKALIDFSKILSTNPAELSQDGTKDLSLQIDNGATCMPDGFPCVCYLNGEFYGIFSFQIKKDTANYHLDEDRLDNIQLDGRLGVNQLWGGNIDWTAFEIRTPEDLICMDGSDYDGDNPSEIIDDTSEYWNPEDENHVRSATVKQYIVNLSKRIGEINTLNETDPSAAKDLFDTYFDADNLIDYQIIQMAVGDPDGFEKNWQWITYDGIKWWACQYDKDQSFGNHFVGMFTTAPSSGGWGNNNVNLPTGLAIRYYQNEHKLRWNEMVEKGIFTKENFIAKIKSWIDRFGEDNLNKEWNRWPQSSCNRDSKIDFDNWVFTGEYSVSAQATWNSNTQYNVGDVVWFDGFNSTNNWRLQFRAIKANQNKPCLTGSYSTYPQTMGYRDSVWRYCKYIEETLNNQNLFINNL